MIKEKILCYNCYELIDVTKLVDEYYEYEEENEAIEVVECERCKEKNAIIWSTSVDFNGIKATEEDIKSFK